MQTNMTMAQQWKHNNGPAIPTKMIMDQQWKHNNGPAMETNDNHLATNSLDIIKISVDLQSQNYTPCHLFPDWL
jgi:hypothetical protein